MRHIRLALPYTSTEGRSTLLALRAAIGGALILLLALAAVVYYQNYQARLVRNTLEVQQLISDFRSSVQAAETTQRGFLLTGNPAYLEIPDLPTKDPDSGFVALERAVQDNPSQMARMHVLGQYLQAKLAELNRTTELAAQGDFTKALLIVNGNSGKAFMDGIEAALADMRNEEQRLLRWRTADSDRSLNWVYVVLTGAIGLLGFGLFRLYGKTSQLVNRLAQERERYREILEQKQVEAERRARLETYNQILITNLEERNRSLERFAYITSHDLQQPLRTITGIIDALQEDFPEMSQGAVGEYFDMVASGASRMNVLITGLLKQTRENHVEEAIPLDLESIVSGVCQDIQQLITEHEAEVRWQQLPFIVGPPTGLRVIIQNLLTNAIKYAHPDRRPEVVISAEVVEAEAAADGSTSTGTTSRWRLHVSDNGRGIAPEYLQKIFDFGERGESHDQEGFGLGLPTCLSIARLLGGELEVKSTLGVGSTFTFSAPGATAKVGNLEEVT